MALVDQWAPPNIQYKEDIYFVPSEVGEALGYPNLSNSIRHSGGFIENIDYKVFTGLELNDLKALSLGSATTRPLFDKFLPSITLLTESGLYAVILKSKKPYAIKIRKSQNRLMGLF
jgi:prophage antirepressor-like protein